VLLTWSWLERAVTDLGMGWRLDLILEVFSNLNDSLKEGGWWPPRGGERWGLSRGVCDPQLGPFPLLLPLGE